jgi:hypothetical protein
MTDGDIYLQIRADERRINDIKLKQTLVRICKRMPELPRDTPLPVIVEKAFERGDYQYPSESEWASADVGIIQNPDLFEGSRTELLRAAKEAALIAGMKHRKP